MDSQRAILRVHSVRRGSRRRSLGIDFDGRHFVPVPPGEKNRAAHRGENLTRAEQQFELFENFLGVQPQMAAAAQEVLAQV